MPHRKRPVTACALSLIVPGLGQLYLGEWATGLVVLCIDAGLGAGIALAAIGPAALRSQLTAILLGLVYPFVWIPAALDAYQRAAGHAKPVLAGGKPWYVILMLLTAGPAAIPLLWHSPRFSRAAKITWTIVVLLVALLFILSAVLLGPAVESSFRSLRDTLNTLR